MDAPPMAARQSAIEAWHDARCSRIPDLPAECRSGDRSCAADAAAKTAIFCFRRVMKKSRSVEQLNNENL